MATQKCTQTIPATLYGLLLPSQQLSITELLKYPMPAILSSCEFKDINHYINDTPPTSTGNTHTISCIPIPPESVVQKLQDAIKYKDKSTSSIKCPHTQTSSANTADATYPLWIVSYWEQLIAIKQVCKRWAAAK